MSEDLQPYLSPEYQARALAEFLAKHVKPYDAATDDYERPPFAEDIKEGKNDPIYNAHSYHTKVPPRSIIPYILHYTQPGDVVLDPFCGSGMTGVAAQMCANPPEDLLVQFPDLKDRVGPRACILNDLSPAACHIAYNYNTPVDVDALRAEFERIKTAVKDEFAWLYGTEHYEPAVGPYSSKSPDVIARLKNPPTGAANARLLDSMERTWELLTRSEVESRLGYPVTELPRDKAWGELDAAQVDEWVCIPAMIQHTIWSDVYRCEGFVTVEEPTGKISTRGKNAGKPVLRKRKVQRGCGNEIVLWNVAVNKETGSVSEDFKCPHCNQDWQKLALEFQVSVPAECSITWIGLKGVERKHVRPPTRFDTSRLDEIERRTITDWHPSEEIWQGRELMTMGANRKGVRRHSDFYTKRNLSALASLYREISKVASTRIRSKLFFCFTAIVLKSSRLNRLRPSGAGDPLTGSLYVASLIREENITLIWDRRAESLLKLGWKWRDSDVRMLLGSATNLSQIPTEAIDYVFTDPPFGGNLYYADASMLWESWLGRFTDEPMELVFNRQRQQDAGFKVLKDYANGMTLVFAEIHRVLKAGRWCTVEFNNSDGAVFEAIKAAVEGAGFVIANMLLLDKKQKSFKQVKGAKGEEDVVDKDVLFNLHKPAVVRSDASQDGHDLEHQLADAVRHHLLTLPGRIQAEPGKYSDEHRTTATINSMLMNSLIPRGVSVEQLNLPFIERVCSRYFRKIGQRWYLRGEAVGGNGSGGLFEEEVAVKDDVSAIDWLRQKVHARPMLIGELKPLWMRAVGLLPADVSQSLSLDELLTENFWRDEDTNRWREPTDEERERMNDDRSIRVLHDADRYIACTLRRSTTDEERCDWIDVLFKACRQVEEGDTQATPTLRDFDLGEGYRIITRLFQSVLRDHVAADVFAKASKQNAAASRQVSGAIRTEEAELKTERKRVERTLFD